jgi:flagellar hook-associated protein 1 FlgK
MATASLDAQSRGIDVTGQNLANVNTNGYSRRTLLLAEAPPEGPGGIGGGVLVQGVQAARDSYVQAQLDTATQSGAYEGALVNQLSTLASALGLPGTSLDAALSSFFNSFSQLATDPTSAVNRTGVIAQGEALAQSFNTMAANLTAAQQSADATARGLVDQVNALTTEVATLNRQIGDGNGANVESLIDQRQVDITQLSNLIGAVAVPSSDGTIGLTVGNGHAIVIGTTSFQIGVGSDAQGLATFTLQDVNVTGDLTGGQVGGMLQVRSTLVPAYQSQLDQLAYNVASQVNTLHQAGTGLTGSTNQAFFTPLAGVAGAAASLTIDATLAGNPNLVAASTTGTAGDNQTALAIANLQATGFVGANNATPSDAWSRLVYTVGQDAASATSAQANQQKVITQLTQLRDAVSKVSTDDEAAQLIKFQQAYLANARYFTVVNDTLANLMTMVTTTA